jgi:hypothetical protein
MKVHKIHLIFQNIGTFSPSKVLLCNPHRRRVSLDVVSTLLINDPADTANAFEPPSRSRCRRLYDIANVLVEMRLVQKRNSMFGTKKIPLFEYCGPEPDGKFRGRLKWQLLVFDF